MCKTYFCNIHLEQEIEYIYRRRNIEFDIIKETYIYEITTKMLKMKI